MMFRRTVGGLLVAASLMTGLLTGLLTVSTMASAGCLSDLGPYEDNYGYARFPFSNSCPESASVSLCVKSWPSGSDEPIYNLYSDTIYGNSRKDLTDGLWSTFDSYEWTENGLQMCPFE